MTLEEMFDRAEKMLDKYLRVQVWRAHNTNPSHHPEDLFAAIIDGKPVKAPDTCADDEHPGPYVDVPEKYYRGRPKLDNLDLGDIVACDSGSLGTDFFAKEGDMRLMFLNQASELALLKWLKSKYPHGAASENVSAGLRDEADAPKKCCPKNLTPREHRNSPFHDGFGLDQE